MNAIIALCHFCDHHGPSTLFCTQAFKYSDLKQINNTKLYQLLPDSAPSNLSATSNLNESKKSFTSLTTNSIEHINTSPTNTQNCKACQAFDKNFHHFISYDNSSSDLIQNKICYLSQSTPNDSEIFALVRKACLRTLHCEVFEDPIYFDDDQNGSVIGYEFNIKDRDGRGFQRSYSLIIIMKDRIYLQHLWSFLSQQMSIIATNIKQEAEKKFFKDMQEKGIHMQTISNSQNGLITTTLGNNSVLTNFKKNSKQVRGLIDLTGDQMIFAKLHMWFTWILRMSSCQISEEFVHGPMSEDLLVKLEREKLKEFFPLDNNDLTNSTSDCFELTNNLSNEFSLNLNLNLNLNQNQTLINKNNTNDQNLLIIKSNSNDKINSNHENNNSSDINKDYLVENIKFESLKQFFKTIGNEKFHHIAYHTIVGNQVIIRGEYECLVTSIITVLEELIPLGCCKSVYYSNEYLNSYKCKLLGLNKHVCLFKEENNEESIILDDLDDYYMLDLRLNLNENKLDLTLFDRIEFKTYTNVKIINQVPSVLTKIESYLDNNSLDEKSISSLIKLAKEEWLNKTKVFYKFYQSPNVKNKISLDGLFEMLKLNKNDELALKYWQAGLSNECKSQIRIT